MSIKNLLQREFKGSNFEIREKLITDPYFTSFLDYVSLPESISKLIEEGYTDKRNQLDEYIDFALHHNLISLLYLHGPEFVEFAHRPIWALATTAIKSTQNRSFILSFKKRIMTRLVSKNERFVLILRFRSQKEKKF